MTFEEEMKEKYWKEYLHDEKNDMDNKAMFYAFVAWNLLQEMQKVKEVIEKTKR